MDEPPKPIGDLLAGIEAQIDAIRSASLRPGATARLTDGRREDPEHHGSHAYVFRRGTWPAELQPDRGLLIRAGPSTPWHPVREFERVGDERVRIRCDVPLGASPVSAEVRDDPGRHPETVAKELRSLAAEGRSGRLDRARFVLGSGSPRLARERNPERWVSGVEGLNRAQRDALSKSLASELTFVWGPPGTGKTEVVAHVVEGALRQGLSVLLVAPTNVAVDQALERVCELVASMPGFDLGLVQRLGDLQVASLRDRYGDAVDPDRTVTRCSAEVEGRLRRLYDARKELAGRLTARRRADHLIEQLDALRVQRSTQESGLRSSMDALAGIDSRIRDASARISAAETGGGFAARRAARRLPTWRAELDGLLEEASRRRAAAAEGRMLLERTGARLAEYGRQADQAMAEAGVQTSAELRRWSTDLEADIAAVEDERRSVRARLASSCRLVATTTHRAVQTRVPLAATDVVVIDEAGMLDLPSAFLLAARAGKRLVVAGDPRQLPAVVPGADEQPSASEAARLIERWVARDAFRAAGVVGPGAKQDDPRLARLDTQYRMRPAICRLVNAMAYPDAPLLTGRADEPASAPSVVLPGPVVLIDTGDRVTDAGTAYRNEVHAVVIRELIRLLQRDGMLPARRSGEGPPTERLAVITPYQQQKALLRAFVRERFGAEYDGLVDTIHRFQGSQRPTVIVDTVTGAGRQVGRFFDGVGLEAGTTRLMNVAVSRARDHLILVANVPFLRAKLPPASQLRVLLDEVETVGARLPVDRLVPIRSAEELVGLADEDRDRPAFFPADEFDRAVEWDLERAVTGVEIYCPFLSVARVRRFKAVLAAVVGRGIDVTVHTRSAEETPSNAEPAAQLSALGCTVRYRDQMHEKIILAGDVLWHGSLNLFSHTRSTELMMRVRSPAACEEVRRTVRRAQPTRAKGGATRPLPGPSADRIYLNVPYAEKNEAKRNGARWDPERRLWWAPAGTDPAVLRRWGSSP